MNIPAAVRDSCTHLPRPAAIGVVVIAVVAATVFGVVLPHAPWAAVSVLVLLPLGLAAPTATVVVIVMITVLIPWDLQNQLKIVGGQGHRGVLFVDGLLILALLRTAFLVSRRRIVFDLPMMLGALVGLIFAAATVWGVAHGSDVSAAGNEGRRVLFGAGTFLLAWPVVKDPSKRRRLIPWLAVTGLALGLWGLAQWLFGVGYSTAGDVGIRGGLSSGQLQGGMYAYPVAVVLAWSALITGAAKSMATRALLAAILAVNIICVFFTFERTIMLCTALGCVVVVILGGPAVRRRAVRWGAVVGALLALGAIVAEAQVRTAFERMALLGDVKSDNSFSHRLIESDVLSGEITAHPLTGSGLGAAVTWGVRDKFATNTTTFADLGYHWLAWKIGLPAAVLVVAILVRAVLRSSAVNQSIEWQALHMGSRAALLALLLIGLLFGVFNALGITAVIGVLVAICYSVTVGTPVSAGAIHRAERGRMACEEGDLEVTR